MKRSVNVLAVALLSLIIVLLGCAKENRVVRIGVITPLTGAGASYGRQTKMGVDLAISELNGAGGINGRKIVARYEDDQMNPQQATSAIQKLITVDKVPVIIGGFTSTATLAIAPIAEKNKVVLFSASSTDDAIKYSGDYIFRNVPTNSSQGRTMADFATGTLGAKSAAILYMNNDYGISLKEAVRSRFLQDGGKISSIEAYNPGDKDFRTQLAKLWTHRPQVIFFPGLYQESGLILKQALELGVRAAFIGGDGSIAPELIEIARGAAEGSHYTNMAIGYGVTDSEIAKFEAAFRALYGEEPSVYSAYAHDAMCLIADAIKRGGYTGEGIKKALYETKAFRGVTGITQFDSYGEVDKPFYIYDVEGGHFNLRKQ